VTHCSHPSDRLELLFPARDYVTGDPFEIRRCGACGLALTWPAPGNMERYYPDAYYGDAGEKRFIGPVEGLQRALYGSRVNLVEKALGRGGCRVLDVGCGRGFLLDAFRRRGWTVEGTEMSDASSSHARDVLGIPVHLGRIEELSLPAESFDAATLWHVLEHVTTPGTMLDAIRKVLRPGGVLLVSVPNFGSPEARATGAGWFHLDVPRHLVHFTPDTLDATLRASGFEPLEATFFAPEFDAFSFVQSTLNRVGLRQNALYDVLRGRAAKLGAGGGSSAAASVALAAPLGVLSVPATLLASLAGAGSTLTVLARR